VALYVGEDDYYKKRYDTRLEKSAQLIEEFIKYVDIEIQSALPRSPLGAALEYRRKLLPSFKIFLTDGSLEIDNNASGRAIKPFIIGEKNWILCNLENKDKDTLLKYMPWSKELPETVKLQNKNLHSKKD